MDAIGAAAVCKKRYGKQANWHQFLQGDRSCPVTSQRAELSAVILALSKALEKYENLNENPWLEVEIHTDSKYVLGCMTEWIEKWSRNGWNNSKGKAVANQDLVKKAHKLDQRLKEEGSVEYIWVPRRENSDADGVCNKVMDEHTEVDQASINDSSVSKGGRIIQLAGMASFIGVHGWDWYFRDVMGMPEEEVLSIRLGASQYFK